MAAPAPRSLLLVPLVVVVFFVSFAAVRILDDDQVDDNAAGAQGTDSSTTVPEPGGDGEARPLGTVQPAQTPESECPAGSTCEVFEVACPDVAAVAPVSVAHAPAQGEARGAVVFFSGGDGADWWQGTAPAAAAFVAAVQADGFEVVQVRWHDSWLAAGEDDDAGTAAVACRGATMVQWAHDTIYQPLGLERTPGRCGFCISGNSGGASQSAFALSHYGLDTIVDAAILTGGPPHAAIAKGCLREAGDEAYWYEESSAAGVDRSYGFEQAGTGPCVNHDPEYRDRWLADSVDTGGSDYQHPDTRIEVLLGSRDRTIAPTHAGDYVERLQVANSPLVNQQTVAGLPHVIERSEVGLDALHQALLAQP